MNRWKSWTDKHQVNIIITTTKNISVNIACIAVSVKRHWKTIWKYASYTGYKESSFQKLTTRNGMTKSILKKLNTNYLLSSARILKVFYVNKTCVSHRHQSNSPPNTSITYHVGAASLWNAVMGDTLNHLK